MCDYFLSSSTQNAPISYAKKFASDLPSAAISYAKILPMSTKKACFQFVECSYILCKGSLFSLLSNLYFWLICQKSEDISQTTAQQEPIFFLAVLFYPYRQIGTLSQQQPIFILAVPYPSCLCNYPIKTLLAAHFYIISISLFLILLRFFPLLFGYLLKTH